VSGVDGHPDRCACARCPIPPDRAPDIEPGTLEYEIWRHRQAMKQIAYEQRFAERSEYRPGFWGSTQS
jgi:hypothetical protein